MNSTDIVFVISSGCFWQATRQVVFFMRLLVGTHSLQTASSRAWNVSSGSTAEPYQWPPPRSLPRRSWLVCAAVLLFICLCVVKAKLKSKVLWCRALPVLDTAKVLFGTSDLALYSFKRVPQKRTSFIPVCHTRWSDQPGWVAFSWSCLNSKKFLLPWITTTFSQIMKTFRGYCCGILALFCLLFKF